jgi:retinol dehydrogenase 14
MTLRTIAITGATEGVGRATALALAARGHTLILHGRNVERLDSVLGACRAAGAHGESRTVRADFASLDEVSALAATLAAAQTIDVLINNAAAMFGTRVMTRDGHEGHFGVNYLAPTLLTLSLLPKLVAQPSARIINLSSVGYKSAQLDWDDLQCENEYGMQAAYFVSKLFNLYFTLSLAERLPKHVTANAVHPGGVQTNLARDFRGPMKWVFAVMMPLLFVSPEKGAETSVFLADDESVAGATGGYYVKKKLETLTKIGADRDARERLWALTAKLLEGRLPASVFD